MNLNHTTMLIALGITLSFAAQSSFSSRLDIKLQADHGNPTHPIMGDRLLFHSTIHNTGLVAIHGLVGWISLIEVDPGNEQPMDLEDWSAHKAITGTTLAPGEELTTDWSMRLIQQGDYRVIISVTDRNQVQVFTSPTLQFHVTRKPVVETIRILPVAFGIPLLLASLLAFRTWSGRRERPLPTPETT